MCIFFISIDLKSVIRDPGSAIPFRRAKGSAIHFKPGSFLIDFDQLTLFSQINDLGHKAAKTQSNAKGFPICLFVLAD
jgi:hypothetical protein